MQKRPIIYKSRYDSVSIHIQITHVNTYTSHDLTPCQYTVCCSVCCGVCCGVCWCVFQTTHVNTYTNHDSTSSPYIYSLLHLECRSISISNPNCMGLFSTERGKRDHGTWQKRPRELDHRMRLRKK